MNFRVLCIILFTLTLVMTNCQASYESEQTQTGQKKTETTEKTGTTDPPADSAIPIGAPIKWYSYEEGMKLGKEQQKKIFLSFYADWCHFCKQMDKNTFTDSRVIAYMNEKFIAIKVNTDKNMPIAVKYSVKGLPVFWILNEEGTAIGQQPGYMEPDKILPLLQFVGTDSYKSMSFNEFKHKKGF